MHLKPGKNNVTNKEYHSQKDWLSSSSLKKILKDPALFYKEEILQEKKEEKENPAFSQGSYMHSLVLEKHKILEEYAFFPGLRKQGALWEAFKIAPENIGKTILSAGQKAQVEWWLKAHESNEAAKTLLQGGESEVTICHEWNGAPIKVRADYANIEEGYLVDLKSSSFPVDIDSFKQTCRSFGYLLSAALYCQIFEVEFGKPFDFYFDVVCKTENDCRVYKVSEISMFKGVTECKKAVDIYKKCKETGLWMATETTKSQQLDIEEI